MPDSKFKIQEQESLPEGQQITILNYGGSAEFRIQDSGRRENHKRPLTPESCSSESWSCRALSASRIMNVRAQVIPALKRSAQGSLRTLRLLIVGEFSVRVAR